MTIKYKKKTYKDELFPIVKMVLYTVAALSNYGPDSAAGVNISNLLVSVT